MVNGLAKRAMRVVHLIGGGEIGGAERQVLDLATHLPEQGIAPQVVCLFPRPFYQLLLSRNVPASVVEMHGKFDFSAFFRLSAVLREIRPQILHTHGVRANLLGRLALGGARVPVNVTTVHSLLAQDYPGAIDRLVNTVTERFTAGRCRRFIAVSRYIADSLIKGGLPAEKVTVIYNGIDPKFYQPGSGVDFRRRYGIPSDAPLLGIVARLHPVKGHRVFLEAARLVAASHPAARFLIVGDGPLAGEIDRLISALGLADCCLRTGFINPGPVYDAIDALIISSQSEGFGLTALEASAYGKPVIATRVGALPEIIEEGKSGLLVPPNDPVALAEAMMKLIDQPESASRLGKKGKKLALERFSLQTCAARTADLYRSLL